MNVACPKATYLIFVLLPILFLFWHSFFKQNKNLQKFAHEKSLQKLLVYSPHKFWFNVVLLSCVWLFSTIALMQPRSEPRYPQQDGSEIIKPTNEENQITRRRKVHDIIFLLDASASMSVTDTTLKQSRLDYAKDIVDEIISNLSGENVAIYAFTSETTKIVPLTTDYLYTRLLLRNIKINEGDVAGTDLLEALETIDKNHISNTEKLTTIILLTDGGDTRLSTLEGSLRYREEGALVTRLGNAQVFTIGLGSHEGAVIPDIIFEEEAVKSSLDEDLLKRLGQYYFANEYTPMTIADSIVRSQKTPFEEEKSTVPTFEKLLANTDPDYTLYYQIPLGLAMLLLVWGLCFRPR
jgi:Ca-activated chloride channel homolog